MSVIIGEVDLDHFSGN